MDYYKLMPTQVDREEFHRLINCELNGCDSQIKKAYNYFDSKLKRNPIVKKSSQKINNKLFVNSKYCFR